MPKERTNFYIKLPNQIPDWPYYGQNIQVTEGFAFTYSGEQALSYFLGKKFADGRQNNGRKYFRVLLEKSCATIIPESEWPSHIEEKYKLWKGNYKKAKQNSATSSQKSQSKAKSGQLSLFPDD